MDLRGVDEVLFNGDLAQRGRWVGRTSDDGKLPDGHEGDERAGHASCVPAASEAGYA
jgi:hypothetical protein